MFHTAAKAISEDTFYFFGCVKKKKSSQTKKSYHNPKVISKASKVSAHVATLQSSSFGQTPTSQGSCKVTHAFVSNVLFGVMLFPAFHCAARSLSTSKVTVRVTIPKETLADLLCKAIPTPYYSLFGLSSFITSRAFVIILFVDLVFFFSCILSCLPNRMQAPYRQSPCISASAFYPWCLNMH